MTSRLHQQSCTTHARTLLVAAGGPWPYGSSSSSSEAVVGSGAEAQPCGGRGRDGGDEDGETGRRRRGSNGAAMAAGCGCRRAVDRRRRQARGMHACTWPALPPSPGRFFEAVACGWAVPIARRPQRECCSPLLWPRPVPFPLPLPSCPAPPDQPSGHGTTCSPWPLFPTTSSPARPPLANLPLHTSNLLASYLNIIRKPI